MVCTNRVYALILLAQQGCADLAKANADCYDELTSALAERCLVAMRAGVFDSAEL